jgi:predicted dehydrogenase
VAVAVGLVGAGRWAREVHAPWLAALPEITFAGVWARKRHSAQTLADEHGVPAYEHYDELVEHSDALSYAVPPHVQAEYAPVAARRGKAVFLEVPIAGDLAGAEDLARAVTTAGVVNQVALTWRFADAVRRFVDQEAPGTQPIGGTARAIVGSVPAGLTGGAWRAGGGVLLGVGPHLVDLLDAALGTVVGVHAHGDPLGWVGLMLEHEGGRFSEASLWATPTDERRADVEVFGTAGTAAVDVTGAVGPEAFRTMFAEFARAVEQQAQPALDVQRGHHLYRVVDAAGTDLVHGLLEAE